MRWTVLLDHPKSESDSWGAAIPWLDVVTSGLSREHALEMARELIEIELVERMAAEKVLYEMSYEYLPTIEVIEMPLPTPEEALRHLQAWDAEDEQDAPIPLAEASRRFGLSVFALRRAICTDRLWKWQCGGLLAVRPSYVVQYLATGTVYPSVGKRRPLPAHHWRGGPPRRP